jgi:hypothetical protein
MNLRVESLQILREILLVTRHGLAIHCRRGASLQPAKRPFQCGYIDMMQQGSESCALVPSCCFADSRKIRWRSDPSLRPDSGDLTWLSIRPTRSLCTPRFLRRHHRYYESVRLLASARHSTLLSSRAAPPSLTGATDPAGPGFQRQPFERDAVHDPVGASPSRITTAHTRPSTVGTASASTTFTISALTTRTCSTPVYASNLASPRRSQDSVQAPLATALAGWDSHPSVIISLFPAHSASLLEYGGTFLKRV